MNLSDKELAKIICGVIIALLVILMACLLRPRRKCSCRGGCGSNCPCKGRCGNSCPCGCHAVMNSPTQAPAVPGVTLLKPRDFGSPLIQGRKAIVFFGVEWCGFCKKLKPTWAELAANNQTNVLIGYIDVEQYPDVGRLYGVTGYPTIKTFTGDNVFDYRGDRDLASLQHLVESVDKDRIDYL